MDMTEKKIIEILKEDPRIPIKTLSEKVKAPASTVRYKLNKLLETGKLRIIVRESHSAKGVDIGFFIVVRIRRLFSKGETREAFHVLRDIVSENLFSPYMASNSSDTFISLVYVKKSADIDFLMNKIKETSFVEDVNIIPIVEEYISEII